jgi:hypothetical protein
LRYAAAQLAWEDLETVEFASACFEMAFARLGVAGLGVEEIFRSVLKSLLSRVSG